MTVWGLEFSVGMVGRGRSQGGYDRLGGWHDRFTMKLRRDTTSTLRSYFPLFHLVCGVGLASLLLCTHLVCACV